MTVGIRVEKRGCSSGTRSYYVFTTYTKERESLCVRARERLHTDVEYRNSNDVASFSVFSSSSTCRSTRMCWEVVVVIVIIIVVVVGVAGAQNKKKKKVKKKPLARRKRPCPVPTCVVCELSCRRHHRRYIYNKGIFFSFLFFLSFFHSYFVQISIHSIYVHSCWLEWFTQFFASW